MNMDPKEVARHFVRTLESRTDEKLSTIVKAELLHMVEQLAIATYIDGVVGAHERKVS